MIVNNKIYRINFTCIKIKIKGIVQVVGFRPFVYRKCNELKLFGYVKNTGNGVEVVVDNKEKY